MMKRILAMAVMLLPATALMAHEGHGGSAAGQGETLWHYVTQPVHLTVFAGIGLGTLLVATIIYRAIKSRTRSASAIGQN